MTPAERVRDSFLEQASYCEQLGSKFMSDLLTGLSTELDMKSETGRRVLEWPGDPAPKADALALRLAGALHALARSGRDQELTTYYSQPDTSSEPEFIDTVLKAINEHDKELSPWLNFAPQTNEVARASAIYAGMLVIAQRFGLPLALYEVGCSGGLNLQCAQFGYCFKGEVFGHPNSLVQLQPEWSGGLPPKIDLEIVSRFGCDLNPLSASIPSDASKLVAYLWPDQPSRIARVENAIAIAKSSPPVLDRSDAAEWVDRKFTADDSRGCVRVLYNTIAWNYFPNAVKKKIFKCMEELEGLATADNPAAWLTFEFDDDDSGPYLKLRTWPGDGEVEILASADPHLHKINWLKNN